jgi:lycopene cyclase domain-containing protein
MPHGPLKTWPQASKDKLGYIVIISALFLTGLMWYTNDIKQGQLLTVVDALYPISIFETKWLYTYLLAFTGVFPLLFGFIPKPSFYNQFLRVLLANFPVTALFIAWDFYFTKQGVWGFATRYTTGFQLIGLPWEECLFFIIIPTACIFIYWSLNTVIKNEPFARTENVITIILIIIFLMTGLWMWEHIYTATACMLSGFLLLYHWLFVKPGYRGRFYLAYLITCIPFLLVNGVLTGGFTESPVVMYNPDENFGVRIGTVPVDDFAYSFLMLFANVSLFEAFGSNDSAKKKI